MNPSYLKAPNLPHLFPYPLVVQSRKSRPGLVYLFTTDSGITYRLLFSPDSEYLTDYSFANSVYSFAISSVTGEVGKADVRIKETVVYAFMQVFEAYPETIITYICSNEDHQERHRRILFGRWFREYGEGFIQLNHTDQDQIYSAAIHKSNHPDRMLIEQVFKGIYDDK